MTVDVRPPLGMQPDERQWHLAVVRRRLDDIARAERAAELLASLHALGRNHPARIAAPRHLARQLRSLADEIDPPTAADPEDVV